MPTHSSVLSLACLSARSLSKSQRQRRRRIGVIVGYIIMLRRSSYAWVRGTGMMNVSLRSPRCVRRLVASTVTLASDDPFRRRGRPFVDRYVVPSRAASFGTTAIRLFAAVPDIVEEEVDLSQVKDNEEFVDSTILLPPNDFRVTAKYTPTGDQPEAIAQLTHQLQRGDRFSILRGITGTGKTLVMAHLIANHGRPTLVLCHNKTLAAQLARELRSFLGDNAVELFVSYYNHYVPESFVEATGKYIAKKSSVNAEIDVLRHRATRALLTRNDVVVVASVSCIYGLGLPKEYLDASWAFQLGDVVSWNDDVLTKLDTMLFEHVVDDDLFERGTYQSSKSDEGVTTYLNVWPTHEKCPMRIEFASVGDGAVKDGMVVRAIQEGTPSGMKPMSSARIFPAKHHVTSDDRLEQACFAIEEELQTRVQELLAEGKRIEADRLQQRVLNDVLMMRETGFCSGGENYSRHLAGREAGSPPDTLMDYMNLNTRDWLLLVDESHVTLPQLKAMYGGDQARKHRLVKHGYRLPSALDNRPLKEEEFWSNVQQTVFVSATPAKQELGKAEYPPVEMMIRPTYVCDPEIEVRSPEGQLDNLLAELRIRVDRKQRALVVTLTKRDAEDLSSYLIEHGISSTYIHSGLSTNERSDALRALQMGEIDCLVGINCLREGLDLPQVSLVAVLNADSEGFLRSETALLQIVGRAARNTEGKAIFYAKRTTEAMQRCIDDTDSRREKQTAYNAQNNCVMKSTNGSSTFSIFDLLKEEIDDAQPLAVVGRKKNNVLPELQTLKLSPAVQGVTGQAVAVETAHIPSSPGVYFWRDVEGNVLYIGKANKLRSRVKSYLVSNAKHSARIKAMVRKASSVDFVLTPSNRDALILESNLIKHHQPPFNVLLKDDEHYPYICASIGDTLPRFSVVPSRQDTSTTPQQRHRYFGPYTSFSEINAILQGIEEMYDLRSKSFEARHGAGSVEEYNALFDVVMKQVFTRDTSKSNEDSLRRRRVQYEEANMLFDSKYNMCRDIVTIAQVEGDNSSAIVQVLQLREGLVGGKFNYNCKVQFGFTNDEDFATAIQTVLERQHYPSGQECVDKRFTWFPDDVLLAHDPVDATELKRVIRTARAEVEPERKKAVSITTVATSGPRREVDARALQFATENINQLVYEKALSNVPRATLSSVDGTAAQELAELLSLPKHPSRIECYDISHTQGEFPVGSRVVFIDGKPAPHLYRKFNIRSEKGQDARDDYSSLEEVLERRFRRAWIKDQGTLVDKESPWAIPDLVLVDGGVGQLGAAIRGMSQADMVPFVAKSTEVTCNSSRLTAAVPICSLAKNEELVFVDGRSEPVNQSPDSPALLLLRSLRDESHRFALCEFTILFHNMAWCRILTSTQYPHHQSCSFASKATLCDEEYMTMYFRNRRLHVLPFVICLWNVAYIPNHPLVAAFQHVICVLGLFTQCLSTSLS